MSAFAQNLSISNYVLYYPSIKNNRFSREKFVMVNRICEKVFWGWWIQKKRDLICLIFDTFLYLKRKTSNVLIDRLQLTLNPKLWITLSADSMDPQKQQQQAVWFYYIWHFSSCLFWFLNIKVIELWLFLAGRLLQKQLLLCKIYNKEHSVSIITVKQEKGEKEQERWIIQNHSREYLALIIA